MSSLTIPCHTIPYHTCQPQERILQIFSDLNITPPPPTGISSISIISNPNPNPLFDSSSGGSGGELESTRHLPPKKRRRNHNISVEAMSDAMEEAARVQKRRLAEAAALEESEESEDPSIIPGLQALLGVRGGRSKAGKWCCHLCGSSNKEPRCRCGCGKYIHRSCKTYGVCSK